MAIKRPLLLSEKVEKVELIHFFFFLVAYHRRIGLILESGKEIWQWAD